MKASCIYGQYRSTIRLFSRMLRHSAHLTTCQSITGTIPRCDGPHRAPGEAPGARGAGVGRRPS
jgi:hypothetical protein